MGTAPLWKGEAGHRDHPGEGTEHCGLFVGSFVLEAGSYEAQHEL